MTTTARELLVTAGRGNRPLATAGLVMLAVLPLCLAGLALDDRVVGGMPVWMKPAKFALSGALYLLTLAWMLARVSVWPRVVGFLASIVAVVLPLEIGIILVQAARGTTSHFNRTTPLDGMLFALMGLGITVVWLASLGLCAALFRQPFADRVRGWSLRLGLAISLAGMALGGLMLSPTAAQMERVRATGEMPVVGAHTVGAPDGGPGLPVTGWSRTHGDQRVAHFLAMHAMQVLPLLGAWVARRGRRGERGRVAAVAVGGASYAALVALVLGEALQGRSVVAPGETTLMLLAGWATLTAVGLAVSLGIPSRVRGVTVAASARKVAP